MIIKVSDNIRLERKTLSLVNVHKSTAHKFNGLFKMTSNFKGTFTVYNEFTVGER